MQKIHHTDSGQQFIDMPPISPCSSCGLCCSHFRVSFPVGEIDQQGSNINVPITFAVKLNDFRAVMKGTEQGGRCVALEGECGKEGVKCSIYANRPSVCREFPVWDEQGKVNPKCNELREKHSLTKIDNLY